MLFRSPYIQAALSTTLGSFGPAFITVAMILFAFTTLIGNLYYVDQCIYHLFKRKPGKIFRGIYYVIAALVILLGAGLSADLLWNIADLTMGAMTLINIPVILILTKYVVKALKNYEAQRKQGLNPTFKAEDIGLPDKVDYWQ